MLKYLSLESVTSVLISSAKSTMLLYSGIIFGKSLIYNMNSRGPRTEPCGTPCLISSHLEEPFPFFLILLYMLYMNEGILHRKVYTEYTVDIQSAGPYVHYWCSHTLYRVRLSIP